MRVLVINGPNLNMLGIREPDVYGRKTFADLEKFIQDEAERLSISVDLYQSNHEGAIVDVIQSAMDNYDGILINPAAYTHTSVAILDAIKAVQLPIVEVHLSGILKHPAFHYPTNPSVRLLQPRMDYWEERNLLNPYFRCV